MSDGLQIRLMDKDADAVEAVRALMRDRLGNHLVITGHAPTRHGQGMRIYGAIKPSVPKTRARKLSSG